MKIAAPLNHEPSPALQRIEVATFFQIPSFHIVGLPSPEVSEARERIRASIDAAGLDFPRRRVVVNLSPASVRKRGTGLDLAMALAVLAEGEESPAFREDPALCVAWGELGLDGGLRSAGQLTRAVYAAWEAGARRLLVPLGDAAAALDRAELIRAAVSWIHPAPEILGVRDLTEAWDAIRPRRRGEAPSLSLPGPAPAADRLPGMPVPPPEVVDEAALMPLSPPIERILGVAAAGAHHVLLLGPKGAGKTHALEWITALRSAASPQIRLRRALLAELNEAAAGGAGGAAGDPRAPVRRIGAQARPGSLIGHVGAGGAVRPGECTLAHGGILVADEFPEWPRDAREALREPLERATVTLTRAAGSFELPARFMLAATGNLCPCGGWPPRLAPPANGDLTRKTPRCRCRPASRRTYLSRLSGPILDRVDLLVTLITALPGGTGSARVPAPSLPELRERVRATRERLRDSWGDLPGDLDGARLEKLLIEKPRWALALNAAGAESARSRHKILRVALSLAAWDARAEPGREHFAEAACYRPERSALCR